MNMPPAKPLHNSGAKRHACVQSAVQIVVCNINNVSVNFGVNFLKKVENYMTVRVTNFAVNRAASGSRCG
jgi:hypothetical protein